MSDKNKKLLSPPSPVVTNFEKRIVKLVKKGKKRGKRYSIIGISGSIIICVISLIAGYYIFININYLLTQAEINRNLNNNAINNRINEKNLCQEDDNCCISSLKIIKKNNYIIYNNNCLDGYKKNGLRCQTSLTWCEPIKGLSPNIKLP